MNIASLSFVSKDELVRMRERINQLESQINIATEFVREIEKGNWNAGEGLGIGTSAASSALTDSLLSLCNQLQSYSLAEKERNWVTEGLAQFIDILRSKNEEIHELTDNIIRSLVKYMNVNQGALYLINDDNPNDVFIEMAACYAYNRKKHMEQRINIGEGLAGQAVIEKDTIYLSDIPRDYVKITSGLGEALPNHILIVPLKIEEKVFGVVEVAAFETIPKYRIDFVQKLGESIASTLANVKNGQKTQVLLQQSRTQTEMMRSQEEEMRQNMEELNATQEEMQRVLKGVQNKEKYLNEIINAPKDSIYILDKEYKVLSYNKMFGSALEQTMGVKDLKGFAFLDLFPDAAERKKQKEYMDRAFAGENFEYSSEYVDKGITSCYSTNYAPLRDEQGKVYAIAGFSKDITELNNARKRAEELLNDSKQQTEELKTQEEELRQNMEELSATQDEIHRVLSEVQGKERYMNELINASSDSILTVDRDMKVINCNEAFKQSYSGFGFEIDKGFDLNNLFASDEDKKKYASYYERVFKGESFKVTEEYTFGEINSSFSILYSPIKDAEGTIIAAAVFVNDITALSSAKKEVEKLLTETNNAYKDMSEKERYLNELINVSNDSIFTMNKEYRVVSFNNALAKGLEQSGVKLEKGFDMMRLLSKEEQEREIANYNRAFKGESLEVVNKIKVGDLNMWFAINYAPLHDSDGKISEIAIFSKDVTALYKDK
jgi:PAS domain S-box-containing protein